MARPSYFLPPLSPGKEGIESASENNIAAGTCGASFEDFIHQFVDHHLTNLSPGSKHPILKYKKHADRLLQLSSLLLKVEYLQLPSVKITSKGKPFIHNTSTSTYDSFSVSHHSELCTLCTYSTPTPYSLGVDIGDLHQSFLPNQKVEDYLQHFAHVLTSPEQAYLSSLEEGSRVEAFAVIWSFKEAYLKAIGTGLFVDMKELSFEGLREGLKFSKEEQVELQASEALNFKVSGQRNHSKFELRLVGEGKILVTCRVALTDALMDKEFRAANFTFREEEVAGGRGGVADEEAACEVVHLSLHDLISSFLRPAEAPPPAPLSSSNNNNNNNPNETALIPFTFNPPNYTASLAAESYRITLPHNPLGSSSLQLTVGEKNNILLDRKRNGNKTHSLVIQQKHIADGSGGTAKELGFGASVYPCAILLSLLIAGDQPPDGIMGCLGMLQDDNGGGGGGGGGRGDHVIHSVLELGAGPGLVSIVAAQALLRFLPPSTATPFYVLATDGDPLSVSLTEENIKGNRAWLNTDEGSLSKIDTLKLLWANSKDMAQGRAKFASNTRKDTPDLLVVADCIALPYAEAFSDLVSTIKEFSRLPDPEKKDLGTVVLIGYHPRGKLIEDKFFTILEDVGGVIMKRLTVGERKDLLHPDFWGEVGDGGVHIEVLVGRRAR